MLGCSKHPKLKTSELERDALQTVFFGGRIATEPRLVHPQAAYELLAKVEVVSGHQPSVTTPART